MNSQSLKLINAHFVLKTETPICHGGLESFGNIQMFRRLPFVQEDGNICEVPVISGNAMRARVFRKEAALKFLKEINSQSGEPKTSKKFVRFLASGGSFEERVGEKVDIDKAKNIKDKIPMVGLLGGAIGGVTIPGIMQVGFCIPIVKETLTFIPDWAKSHHVGLSSREIIETIGYTRKSEDNNQAFLSLTKEQNNDVLDSDQMIYHIQTMKAGVPLFWRFSLQNPTSIEYDLCMLLLQNFKKNPVVGGVNRVGHGMLSFVEEKFETVSWDGENVTHEQSNVGELYNKFLSSNIGDLSEFVKSI